MDKKEPMSSVKIYTKQGDEGYTRTLGGKKIWKGDIEIELLGQLDELMTQMEKVMALIYRDYSVVITLDDELEEYDILKTIRQHLWMTSAEIASSNDEINVSSMVTSDSTKMLEKYIDSCKINLRDFVVFKDLVAIEINEARVRTRKIERTMCMVPEFRKELRAYFNRLSDFFFAMAYVIERNDT